MSWDIVLFNSRQKIKSVEEVDETLLEPTDFCSVFENTFENVVSDGNHREIKGKDFAIDYFIDNEPVSNKMLSLYGENGLFELVVLAKKKSGKSLTLDLDKCLIWKILRPMVMKIIKTISNTY